MFKIVITTLAEKDLKEITRYISIELQNMEAAKCLIDEIEKIIGTLSQMPLRNPLVRDEVLANNGFRFISIKNYLVFYIVREASNSVVIERILYKKRDWNAVL